MSDLSKLQERIDAKEKATRQKLVKVCSNLLDSPSGMEWFDTMREHFEVDRPRFRRGDANHDDALLRDGAAEVFYMTQDLARRGEQGKDF